MFAGRVGSLSSASKMRNKVENRREHDADEKRCPEWSKEAEVFASVRKIARQPPHRKPHPRRQQQQASKQDAKNSDAEESLPKFTHDRTQPIEAVQFRMVASSDSISAFSELDTGKSGSLVRPP